MACDEGDEEPRDVVSTSEGEELQRCRIRESVRAACRPQHARARMQVYSSTPSCLIVRTCMSERSVDPAPTQRCIYCERGAAENNGCKALSWLLCWYAPPVSTSFRAIFSVTR
eukprot:3248798-Pleurochrysis_carterae.AAC.1